MHAGFGVSAGAAAGLLAGFGMYEGIKSAASEQLAMFYTVLASGMDPTSPTGRAFAAKVRDTAEQTSLGTIFSRLDVAKMMPGIAGKADVPLAQALPFMRSAIQFGEIERQFGASIGHDFDARNLRRLQSSCRIYSVFPIEQDVACFKHDGTGHYNVG